MQNETEFIELLKQGEETSWRELVEEFKDKVFKTALSYIPFADEAEDLTQDVFVEVYKSIQNFRGDSSLSTWIFRITVNKAINYLKKNKKHHMSRSVEDYDVFEPSESEITSDASEIFQQKEYRRIIQQAIRDIPERQASVFVLHKIEGKSYKEISDILNISVSSVESLMFRARKALQTKLLSLYRQMYK